MHPLHGVVLPKLGWRGTRPGSTPVRGVPAGGGQSSVEATAAGHRGSGGTRLIAKLKRVLDFWREAPILKRVANQLADIDRVLQVLADPTRRSILERLSYGSASVTSLAAPLPMSLPAVVQHLERLESAGLVSSEKVGRVRTCRLEVGRLDVVEDWIVERRHAWERRLDRLGESLAAEATSTPVPLRKLKESAT